MFCLGEFIRVFSLISAVNLYVGSIKKRLRQVDSLVCVFSLVDTSPQYQRQFCFGE